MFKWLKSVFKSAPTPVEEKVEAAPTKVPAPKAKPKKVKPTAAELMEMTKKEMIQYATDHNIEVKDHWTKKNIAAEIVAKS